MIHSLRRHRWGALVALTAALLATLLGTSSAQADTVAPGPVWADAGQLATPYFNGINSLVDRPCLAVDKVESAQFVHQGSCDAATAPRWENAGTGKIIVSGTSGPSALCLDTENGNVGLGTQVVIGTCKDMQLTQYWHPIVGTKGFYQLKQDRSGLCLTGYDEAPVYPNTIQACINAPNQEFTSLAPKPLTITAQTDYNPAISGTDILGHVFPRTHLNMGLRSNLLPGTYAVNANGWVCGSTVKAPPGVSVSCIESIGTFSTTWTIRVPNEPLSGGTLTIS